MHYTYDLDDSCNNIVIEYIKASDKNISMQSTHYHDFYEFYFYLGESMTYFINNTSYLIQKYDLVFIDKNTFHRTIYNSNQKERILIMFREEFFDVLVDSTPVISILKSLAGSPIISFNDAIKKKFYTIIQDLVHLSKKDTEDLFALKIKLIDLILVIKGFVNEGLLLPISIIDSKKNLIISNITNYINNNYNEKITLDDLSNQFYIDKHHLCHIFKKITGMTVIEFINNKRLTEAKRLLKSSDYNMLEISTIVGFQNQNHFNTLFKRATNQTPLEFKTNARRLKNNN